jgi:hypothetical protein
MFFLTLNEIFQSIPQYDSELRGFLFPLALSNVVGPHQVVHRKCTWRRILNSLSERNYEISLHCTKCSRRTVWEVLIALCTGLKITESFGETFGRHLLDWSSGGQNTSMHANAIGDGNPKTLYHCKEFEGADDQQLLQELKHLSTLKSNQRIGNGEQSAQNP